jgi:hypothetical protein
MRELRRARTSHALLIRSQARTHHAEEEGEVMQADKVRLSIQSCSAYRRLPRNS